MTRATFFPAHESERVTAWRRQTVSWLRSVFIRSRVSGGTRRDRGPLADRADRRNPGQRHFHRDGRKARDRDEALQRGALGLDWAFLPSSLPLVVVSWSRVEGNDEHPVGHGAVVFQNS